MANATRTNDNFKNDMLDAYVFWLDTLVALDGSDDVRSNAIDSNFATPSGGLLQLDQTVNSGNRTLTIQENSDGQQAISRLRLTNETDTTYYIDMFFSDINFPLGGDFIVTTLEIQILDKVAIA